MKHNMEYIDLEEYMKIVKLPMFHKKKSLILFLRFLKDNRLFCLYKRNFNDFACGREYRRTYAFSYEDKTYNELIEFCNANVWKWFIVDAFMWDKNEFWHNVHCKWIEYCMEQHERDLI